MNGGARNIASNDRSGANPGIRQRTSRPSLRASASRTERAASHRRSGGASLSRRWATRIEGFASQWSRSGMHCVNTLRAMTP